MLYGRTPWFHDKVHELQKMIQHESVQFPAEPAVSPQLKTLITKMLAKQEIDRINILQVQEALNQY